MKSFRILRAFGSAAFLFLPLPSLGQATVDALVVDGREVAETSQLKRIPLGNVIGEAVQKGDELKIGDELKAESTEVAVELHCAGGSALLLEKQFRIAIWHSADGECAIDLKDGRVEVMGLAKTKIRVGEVILGTRRTQYGIEVAREGEEVGRSEIRVWEGEIDLSAPGAQPRLFSEGRQVVMQGGSIGPEAKLDGVDARDTATFIAELDLALAKSRGGETTTQSKLVDLYESTLLKPRESESRLSLGVEQINLRTQTRRTDYQLRLAEALLPEESKPELRATVVLAQAVALQQRGESDAASKTFERARKIDPDVNRGKIRRKYGLDVGYEEKDATEPKPDEGREPDEKAPATLPAPVQL
jgi:hypothetical protein